MSEDPFTKYRYGDSDFPRPAESCFAAITDCFHVFSILLLLSISKRVTGFAPSDTETTFAKLSPISALNCSGAARCRTGFPCSSRRRTVVVTRHSSPKLVAAVRRTHRAITTTQHKFCSLMFIRSTMLVSCLEGGFSRVPRSRAVRDRGDGHRVNSARLWNFARPGAPKKSALGGRWYKTMGSRSGPLPIVEIRPCAQGAHPTPGELGYSIFHWLIVGSAAPPPQQPQKRR